MYRITYRAPYSDAWRTQSFASPDEAQKMIEFYRSCGVPARVTAPQWN